MHRSYRFTDPAGLALDGRGNLYIADSYNNAIRRADVPTAAVTTLAGSPALSPGTEGIRGSTDAFGAAARFYLPRGVAADGAGNVYVADAYNSAVRKVQIRSGVVTTVVGSVGLTGVQLGLLPARLNFPRAVAVSAVGELFILDENSVLLAH